MRLLIAIAFAALPLQARTRTVQFPNRERVLVILAHPDDEALLAPLLGKKCVEEEASCTLLTLSRGENSYCRLPDGCPNLGDIRAAELQTMATAFHLDAVQWSFADVFTPDASWPADAANRVAAFVAEHRPDIIYTFDPNHGSSCHEAHRYTALLAIAAAHALPVQMIETEILRFPTVSDVSFAAATKAASSFDARPWWHWIVTNLEAHRSQFSLEEVAEIRDRPEAERRIWLLDAKALGSVSYDYVCP